MTIKLNTVLAACMGDAYGFPREYRKDDFRKTNTGEFYEIHPTHPDVIPGNYSDDGQMTIANGEILLADRKISTWLLDNTYVEAYMRDPRAGYSKGMLQAIKKAYNNKLALSEVCFSFGKSEKSGAAMRASVFGSLPDIYDVRSYARFQGRITHEGNAIVAAEAAALASHYMLYNKGPRSNLPSFLATTLNDDIWNKPWQGKVGSPGMDSTRAAITAIVQATSLKDLLIRSCHYGGDVDTVACIATAAAWAYPCLPNDIPEKLFNDMENGPYGRDYAFNLGEKLLQKFQPPLQNAA